MLEKTFNYLKLNLNSFNFKYNDIAILTLDAPVTFSRAIRPVCLPSSGFNYQGSTGTVVGWGSLRENGPQPAVLQEVNLPIWTNQQCAIKYGSSAPGGIIDSMICAGVSAKDSCSGDSGKNTNTIDHFHPICLEDFLPNSVIFRKIFGILSCKYIPN